MPQTAPRIAILGAGPIGLEAALAAAERNLPFTVYDARSTVAGHVRDWGHVRVFTPWDLNVSPRMRTALEGAGAEVPSGAALPTGNELAARLYDPVGELPAVSSRLQLDTRVDAVGREGLLKHEEIGTGGRSPHPFRLLLTGPRGEETVAHADVVLDCTGTYGNPNALGDGGIPAPGERRFAERIVRRLPAFSEEPEAWAGKRILLTGAGHSAQTAARELAEFARDADGTQVVWAVRSPDPDWGAVENDPLPERATLTADAEKLSRGASPAIETRRGRVVEALGGRDDRVAVTLRDGQAEEVVVDRILALNGGVGDFTLYRQLQVHECYATAAPMNLAAALLGAGAADCMEQESHGPDTLRNPEPGFFLVGAKSYGRNSQFLVRIGWAQIDDIFALVTGTAA